MLTLTSPFETRLHRLVAGGVHPHVDALVARIGRGGLQLQLQAAPWLAVSVLHGLFLGAGGAVVACEVHRDHVAVGRLPKQALLRREADAGLARRVVKPQVLAVVEDELVGVARGRHVAHQVAELAASGIGPGIDGKLAGIGLPTLAVFHQRVRQPE